VPIEGYGEIGSGALKHGGDGGGGGKGGCQLIPTVLRIRIGKGGGCGDCNAQAEEVAQGAGLGLTKGRATTKIFSTGLWTAALVVHRPGKIKVSVQVHAHVLVAAVPAAALAVLPSHPRRGGTQVELVCIRITIGPKNYTTGR